MTEDSLTSGQRAVSARQAISAYAKARHHPLASVTRDAGNRDPVQEQDLLSRLLCALRHHADHVSTLSLRDSLNAIRQDAGRPRASHPNATRAAVGGHALDAYERDSRAPALHRGSAWPVAAMEDLRAYAGRQGISFEAAIAELTAALVTDLRHYADRHGADFEAAITTSSRAYTEQRLREEGPFETGQEARSRPATLLAAVPATAIFRPVPTHQGVVTAFGDAEWHLVRTAARILDRERRGFQGAYLPDTDDRRVLSDALSEACGLTSTEILRKLTDQIEARAIEIERGVTAAADLGCTHGRSRPQPYCDLDAEGDAAVLLGALGETEQTTGANHPYRLALITAYAEAYQQVSAQGQPAATSPACIAARDFPRHSGQPTPQGRAPAAPGPASQAQARPGARPRRGHA